MNRHQKKFLGTAVAILNVAFSLSVGAIATYAWFQANASANISTNSTSTQILVDAPDISVDFWVYRYDFNAGTGRGWKNDATQFFLAPYEHFLKEDIPAVAQDYFDNSKTNAIVKIVASDLGEFNTAQKELNFVITCDDENPYITSEKVNSYTSNISQFKCILQSYTLDGSDTPVVVGGINETSDSLAYSSATTEFSKIETPTTFISVNGTAFNKNGNQLTITPYLPQGTNDEGLNIKSATFYIECSYNDRLVEKYISTHENDGNYDFLSVGGDVTQIKIKKSDNTKGTSNSGKYVKLTSNYNVIDGNYLAVYRDNMTGDNSDKGVAFNAGKTNVSNAVNYENVDIVNNTIVSYPNTNNSSLKYSIENESDPLYRHLQSSKYRGDSSNGWTYSATDNRKNIGGSQAVNGEGHVDSSNWTVNRNNTNYLNTLNVQKDGKTSVKCDTSVDSVKTSLLYNSESNSKGFKYYENQSDSNIKPIEMFRYAENAGSVGILTSITLETGYKTVYYSSQSFEKPTVLAHYSDGGVFDVTNLADYSIKNTNPLIEGEDNISAYIAAITSPNPTIVVTYEEYNGIVKTVEYQISISALAISSVIVSTAPTKTTYYEKEQLNYAGMVVTVNYNDGTHPTYSYPNASIVLDGNYPQSKTLEITDAGTVYVGFAGTNLKGSFNLTVNQTVISFINPAEKVKIGSGNSVQFTVVTTPANQTVNFTIGDSTKATIVKNSNTQVTVTGVAETLSVTLTATIANTGRSVSTNIRIYDNVVYKKIDDYAINYNRPFLIVYENSSTEGYVFNSEGDLAEQNYNTKTISTVDGVNQIVCDDNLDNEIIFHVDPNNSDPNKIPVSLKNSENKYLVPPSSVDYDVVKSDTEVFSTDLTCYTDGTWGLTFPNDYVLGYFHGPNHSIFEFTNHGYSTGTTYSTEYFCLYAEDNPESDIVINTSDEETKYRMGQEIEIDSYVEVGKDGYDSSDIVWSGVTGITTSDDGSTAYWTPHAANGVTAGNHTIRATLPNGNYDEITITLGVLSSISVDGYTPTGTLNQTYAFDGTITANYTNGVSSRTIANNATGVTITDPSTDSPGSSSGSVQYIEEGVTKSTSFSITVSEAPATKTYTLTISASSISSHNSYGSWTQTFTAVATDSSTTDVTISFNDVMYITVSNNGYIQIKKTPGYIYNTTDLGSINNVSISTYGSQGTASYYINSSQNPTSSGSGGYFRVQRNSGTPQLSSITITFTK